MPLPQKNHPFRRPACRSWIYFIIRILKAKVLSVLCVLTNVYFLFITKLKEALTIAALFLAIQPTSHENSHIPPFIVSLMLSLIHFQLFTATKNLSKSQSSRQRKAVNICGFNTVHSIRSKRRC